MSLSSLIGHQIPLLRRYARALSGSQASGDAYVAALLETLLADPEAFDRSADPREETYRLFSRVSRTPCLERRRRRQGHAAVHARPAPGRDHAYAAEAGFPAHGGGRLRAGPGEPRARRLSRGLRWSGRGGGPRDRRAGGPTVAIIEDEPLIAMDLEILVTTSATRCWARRHQAEAVALAARRDPAWYWPTSAGRRLLRHRRGQRHFGVLRRPR